MAWRRRERWPRWAHTHLRLSSKEGAVAIAVAITFAHIAGKLRTPTRTPRMVRLIAVEMAETEPYLISFRRAARREGEVIPGMERSIHARTVGPVWRASRPAETGPHELG